MAGNNEKKLDAVSALLEALSAEYVPRLGGDE